MVLEQDREQREQSLRIQQARAQRQAIAKNEEERRKATEEQERKEKEAEQKKKKIQAEKDAIEKAYQLKLSENPYDPKDKQRYGSRKRGKYKYPFIEYKKAAAQERDRALAKINIRESGVQIKHITLSRTASQVMRGKVRSSDYHVAYQVGIAQANQALRSGKITPEKYKTHVAKISREYSDAQASFTRRNTPSAASLRAEGNTQVYSGIDAELKRLGGQGLGGDNTKGATMVSATLEKDSPSIGKRVPVAPGVAAKSQDFSKEFKYQPQVVQTSSRVTPQMSFAAIATPGTSFGKVQSQVAVEPLRKNESVRNRTSPLIIPMTQRSDIGYSPEGKPIQGAPWQQQRYSVTDSSGKVRTFKDLQTAQKFAERTSKEAVTPVNIAGLMPPQRSSEPRLTPTGKIQHGLSKTLDDIAQFKTGNKYADMAYSAVIGHPVGSIRSVVEGVNVLDNLGKHEIPKYLGRPTIKGLDPIPIQRTGDEVVLPVAIDSKGIRMKSGGEIKTDVTAYAKKYSTGDLVGGAISTYVPIGLGIKSGVQTISKTITKKVTPKLVSAATSEKKLIGYTPTIKKSPLIVKERIPYVGKDTLLDQVKTRQHAVSGNPKLPKPYTPSSKPNVGSGVIPKENIKGKITLSKGFMPNKPSRPYTPLDTKKSVKTDPTYTPTRRPGEIDVSDSALAGIKQTQISLGTGITKAPAKIINTAKKPVKTDPSYVPSKRPNEIDISDSALAGIKETKISLGSGATKLPSGVKKSYGKKLDFSNPWRVKPRKFDEPKIGKDDKLVGGGDGSVQIVKVKTDVVKLKKKQVTPVKIKVMPESLAQTPKMTSVKPVSFLIKPAGRLATKKKKPVKAISPSQTVVYETVYTRRLPAKAAGVVSMAGIPSLLSQTASAHLARPATVQSNKTKTFSSVKLKPHQKSTGVAKTKQPSAIKQAAPQKPQLRSPQKTRLVPKQKAVLRSQFKTSPRLVQMEKIKTPPRRKPVGEMPFFDSDDRKRKKKGEKRADFLGNVRLGSIEGFVKRSDITYGRKKIGKLIRKDPSIRGKRQKGVRVF